MHFLCKCGKYRFHDSSDCLPYKGCIYPDEDTNTLGQLIEDGFRTGDTDTMWSGINALFRRTMYQCPECGRLYIENDDYSSFTVFTPNGDAEPDPAADKRMLESMYGKTWNGFLYAVWNDNHPEWVKHSGTIRQEQDDDFVLFDFDDYEQFRMRFDELFAELRQNDRIRSATLKVNGKCEFSWLREQSE